ncbi:family 43 glycosylhydrolase [Microbacterium sp. NPDC077663]|uniref:family 43 glycosylhydrolase n=1 Tax=Microbacterium sp. NPDC077663 TaxID=3364189 RepID=UPI0037CA3B2E
MSLYRDPIFDGAADPVVIQGPDDLWWMVYTARRANLTLPPDVTWIHGTALGVATSIDGTEWTYRGTLTGLDIEPGHHTYWAPEIIEHDGIFHMYVSVIRGIPSHWQGHERVIRHYTSRDLWEWQYQSTLELTSRHVIDACVYPLPGGGWRLWYKDEADGAHTWAADSNDLHTWTVRGPVVRGRPHEGPNVFRLDDWYWMIVDEWDGQRVLRSDDLDTWTEQGRILDGTGVKDDDIGAGLHADVVVRGDDAIAFYFTHPEWDRGSDPLTYADKRTTIQAARITTDGTRLLCDRSATADLPLIR